MVAVPGFAYFPVEFDKLGRPAAFGNARVRALEAALGHDEPTDLIVMSHGWNNDMAEAEALYQELFANMRGLLEGGKYPSLRGRTFAVLGVLWPSKKFADQELIPGLGAGVRNTIALESVRRQLDDLRGAFDADSADESLMELQELLPKLEDSDPAGRRFVELCRTLIRTKSADDEAQSDSFFGLDSLDVYTRLQLPASFTSTNTPAVEEGGALGVGDSQGNAEGLGDFFSGSLSAARNILNYTTYYQMKERAGVVGGKGLNPILQGLLRRHGSLKLHLIGHSFGGRLVTATLAGWDEAALLHADSLTLLQAAFSHYGFSADLDGKGKQGFFHRVIAKKAVSGPIAITCTRNDLAVGAAYPIASLLAGQDAAGLGDKDSRFGGLGRNGAQKSNAIEDLKMVPLRTVYPLEKGQLYNLEADSCIGSHGDVRNVSVAGVVLANIAAS